jgi:hypothetical protein
MDTDTKTILKQAQLTLMAFNQAALEAAIVHLAQIVADKTGMTREEMADSFKNHPLLTSNTLDNKDIYVLRMHSIAQGILGEKMDLNKPLH